MAQSQQTPAARPKPPTFDVCGVPIAAAGLVDARDLLLDSHFGNSRSVHLCNAYTLSLAVRDARFRSLLCSADLNLADGHPVASIGRRRGFTHMTRRAYGPDVMEAVLDAGRERGLRHYLLGGSPEVVHALAETIRSRFPGVALVGVESPPFRALSETEVAELIDRLRSARPDIVWVGLGTPRQDEFVAEHAVALGCTLVPVGAAFDFLAGAKRQAPALMREHGLEWLFRLLTEPRRLWRRYLVGNLIFSWGVARDRRARRSP